MTDEVTRYAWYYNGDAPDVVPEPTGEWVKVSDLAELALRLDAAYQPLIDAERDIRVTHPELADFIWSVVTELQAIKRTLDP